MRSVLFAAVFAAPLLFAAGCGKGKTSGTGGPTGDGPPLPPTEVVLTEGGVADIDKAAKDTKNAVVLVEFWTMAAEPSPDLALAADLRSGGMQDKRTALAKDKVAWNGVRKGEYLGKVYGGHFLRVIMVNVDGPEKKDEVLKFLKDHDARNVTNILWKDTAGAAAERYGFTGKAPHQALFGRNGSRVWVTGEPFPGAETLDSLIFQELGK